MLKINLSFISLDPHLFGETLVAHTDAVWDLAYHIDTDHLLSCSADGTCKLWSPSLKTPLIASYSSEGMISFTIIIIYLFIFDVEHTMIFCKKIREAFFYTTTGTQQPVSKGNSWAMQSETSRNTSYSC